MIHGTPQIFEELQTIFIHIPKCGGTSIEKTLGGSKYGGHSFASTLKIKYKEIWESYYTFTIVREPFSRFASAYNYLKQRNLNPALQNKNILLSKDINDYIVNYFRTDSVLHMLPQYNFITDNDEIIVDDVFKYEELENSWKKILTKLNVPIKELPHMNKTKKYSIEYSKESMDILYEYYKKDFELLHYY